MNFISNAFLDVNLSLTKISFFDILFQRGTVAILPSHFTASPGVKEASLGLGMLASGTLSVYGGFELNLGVELGKNWHFYGGIYFDYDFSISGKFLWREYGGVGLDDLAPHQRIVLVDFGNGN